MNKFKVLDYQKKETEIQKAIREHKEMESERIEAFGLLAKDYKDKYDALVKEGFDKKEALQILIYSTSWK